MKSGKEQITEVIKLPNQERIRTLGEEENYKYLERDQTIGDERIKYEKSISDERESFSKPNSATKISSKW